MKKGDIVHREDWPNLVYKIVGETHFPDSPAWVAQPLGVKKWSFVKVDSYSKMIVDGQYITKENNSERENI